MLSLLVAHARTGTHGTAHHPGLAPAGRDQFMARTAACIDGPAAPLWASCWLHWSYPVALAHKLGYTLVFGVSATHLEAHDQAAGRRRSEKQAALLRTSREMSS